MSESLRDLEAQLLLLESLRDGEEERREVAADGPHAAAAPDDDPAVLSFAQERLWFLDRLEPGSAAYNVPLALRLVGELSAETLSAVLAEVRRRHPVLRSRFAAHEGEPRAVLEAPAPAPPPRVDRDLATHLVRTRMLEAGYTLSQVTTALCRRWQPGVRLLPMSDDRVETHIVVEDPTSPSGNRVVHFQEYWVKDGARTPARSVLTVGIDKASPAPGVLEAIGNAEVVIVPPSNPIVSVGTILAVPGVREALTTTSATVVGLSPIVAGDHVRGMAAQLLAASGVEVSAAGVADLYGARSSGGILDAWLVDERDEHLVPRIEALGMRSRATPLMMTTAQATAEMAAEALLISAPSRGSTAP